MGDLVFVGSCNGILHAVDRRTGGVRWTYQAAALDGGKPEFHGRPLITDELVVVGSDDRRAEGIGYVYAFKRPSLDLAWKQRIGAGTMTDIVQFGNSVFFVTLADELISLDLRTGAVRWKAPSGASNERFARSSTPAVTADRVIFGGLNGKIVALDAKSGTVVWRQTFDGRVSTSITVVGEDVFLGTATGGVHRLDANTGATEAELRLDGSPDFRLVGVGQSLLVFVTHSGVTALKSVPLTLEAVRWTQVPAAPGWTSLASPYVWKEWVVAGKESGEFVALRLIDGQPAWRGQLSGAIAGISGDETSLYLGTVKGTVYSYPLPGVAR